ncbi:MAG: SDR family NAD(P)-dependent oxidoreductase, partial [Verrucomicrobiota bacterium]
SSPLPFRIRNRQPGSIEQLSLSEELQTAPGAGEVEIAVAGAGINFRDLMKSLGSYPAPESELDELGDDFSGTVLRTGSGVSNLKRGDHVFGIATSAFSSHLRVPAQFVRLVPSSLSLHEASGIPTVFLTAHYALRTLAQLERGQSILIHSAAGGVGLAAVRIATFLGLEIFATAGSEEKRSYLRTIGVKHIFDSRSLLFADDIRKVTKGRGVDAVLNSLSGDSIRVSLGLLKPFGRFLEIGKIDLYADRKLGLRALKENIRFFVIDLAQLLSHCPEESTLLFDEVEEAFRMNHYASIPTKTFPISEFKEAFRTMAKGEQIGKLIIDFQPLPKRLERRFQGKELFPRQRSYLISGGTSGFGLKLAQWMIENGARHLVLISRRGSSSPQLKEWMREPLPEGVEIHVESCDVADFAAIRELVDRIGKEIPPLDGVFHAAMALKDNFLHHLDQDDLEFSLHPKLYGGWSLHAATADLSLSHFVCFSSFAGVVGSLKQAGYNAGNCALDELCRYRRAIGLNALSVNWGAISETGYIHRNKHIQDYLEEIGVEPASADEALGQLGQLLRHDVAQVAAAKADWDRLAHLAPAVESLPTFSLLRDNERRNLSSGALRRHILSAPVRRQLELVRDFLLNQIASVFATDSQSLDPAVPITTMGIDSLMSIELLNRIEGELGISFPMGGLLSGPSIDELAQTVLNCLQTLPANKEEED